jgi:porin
MKKVIITMFLIILLISCYPLYGEENSFKEFMNRSRLLDDPFGYRTKLEEHGFTFDFFYTSDFFFKTHGGLNDHDGNEYRGDLSLYLQFDTEKAGLWNDGLFLLYLQEEHGHGLTEEHVGDYQLLDNIDGEDFRQVSEFWYEHSFLDDMFVLKFGKQDANFDFAHSNYSYEFINSSAAYPPTIPLASSPDQDWGVVLKFKKKEFISLKLGVYQARIDGGRSIRHTAENLYGPMVVFEPELSTKIAELPGFFRVGLWWSGDKFENLKADLEDEEIEEDEMLVDENYGWYMTLDQLLWKENAEDEEDCEGVGLFMQYGWGKEDRSELKAYYGGGFQWTGLIPKRNDDILGLGAFHADFGDEAEFEEDNETAFEFFYQCQFTGWMSVKHDFQYISNPGGTSNKDAFVVGVRLQISL